MTNDNEKKDLVLVKPDITENNSLTIINNIEVKATAEDLAWQESLFNMRWSLVGGAVKNRGLKFSEAVENGHLWRVTSAHAFNETQKSDDKFITKIRAQEALNISLAREHKEVADFLLKNNFLETYGYNKQLIYQLIRDEYKDILKGYVEKKALDINAFEQQALYKAASSTGNEQKCLFILDLGSDYNHALRRLRNDKFTKDNIDMLQKVIEIYEEGHYDLNMIFEKEKKKETAKKKEEAAGQNWEVVDQNIIVKHTEIKSTRTRIQTMFNFMARDISTMFFFYPDNSSKVIMKNFKDIEDESVLYEAWQKLKDAGEDPVPFDGNDSFQVNKPTKKQKINIEGR